MAGMMGCAKENLEGEVLADAVQDPGGEGSGDGRDEQHPVYLQLCGGVKNKTLSENIIRGQKNIK